MKRCPVPPRSVRAVLASASLLAAWTPCATHAAPGWQPQGVWVQAGTADHAQALTLGLLWDWSWQRPIGRGVLSGYWEASVGRWHSNSDAHHTAYWVTQVGLTPTLRWQPGSWPEGLMLELGVGLNTLVPLYRNGDKRFSTAFNFGDHLALVRQFGDGHRHELALRWQHFSNAGIHQPNPGENFLQLRYTQRF